MTTTTTTVVEDESSPELPLSVAAGLPGESVAAAWTEATDICICKRARTRGRLRCTREQRCAKSAGLFFSFVKTRKLPLAYACTRTANASHWRQERKAYHNSLALDGDGHVIALEVVSDEVDLVVGDALVKHHRRLGLLRFRPWQPKTERGVGGSRGNREG